MKQPKGILCLTLFAITLLWLPGLEECRGEQFPNRPITAIINYGAGGQTDIVVRLLAKLAEKDFAVPIIIENKAGGGGTIGVAELARAKPDGYTIGTLTIGAMSSVPLLQKVAYDSFKDFDYISGFGRYLYGVYARSDSPFRSIKDVVEAAQKNPGKITYGAMSPGIAIGLKYVEAKENVKMTYIPFQSGQESAMALVGGHINLSIGTPDSVIQFIEKKEVTILAVVSEERWPFFPNVPTMKELGYDIDISGWMAFGAPRGVPKDRLAVIYNAFKKAHSDPEVKATLEKIWLYAPYIPGEEVKTIFQKRAIEWKPSIEALKTKQLKK